MQIKSGYTGLTFQLGGRKMFMFFVYTQGRFFLTKTGISSRALKAKIHHFLSGLA